MLARLRKSEEREGGFTLIELLVVIIIIGILAAIAIPTFLNQRKKGWRSSVKSALKNGATAQESYFTDNDTYASTQADLVLEGFNASTNVAAFTIVLGGTPAGQTYCMSTFHSSNPTDIWHIGSEAGFTAPVTSCTP